MRAIKGDIAINVSNISKYYQIYDSPRDRLKQFVMPRLQQMIMRQPKQYFREFWALRDTTFEIKRGETVGIVGRNGSGKSTLLQIICGTLNPSTGKVETNGRIAALLELGSGFNPEFTGRENVYMNGAILGLNKEEIDEIFNDIIEFADIGDFIDQPVKTYSSGMVMRLAFAVAANVDPQILVVDEALAVGDELFQRKCFSRIEAIREGGATILFVSHAAATIVELCDSAILIDSGELLAKGEPKKIIATYQKFLYAPAEKKKIMKEKLKSSPLNELSSDLEPEDPNQSKSQTTIKTERKDFFEENLKPQSTVAYESYGAFIEDPKIFTMDNNLVNNLCRGNTYRYSYNVRFERACTNVRFGMVIKTTSGIEIGGAVSAAGEDTGISFVRLGTTLNVGFNFDCILNPGTYYLNAGVLGVVDENGEQYLHRLLDALVFRVLPIPGNQSSAMVDLNCRPVIIGIDGRIFDASKVDQRRVI